MLRLMTLSHIMPFLQVPMCPLLLQILVPQMSIFSLLSAVIYVFYILQANISRFFNSEIVKAILTESLDTTYKNVIEEGAVVVCPRSTSCAFILNFSPSLI